MRGLPAGRLSRSDITHPRRGDLLVELISPSGTTIRLHSPSSDTTPNLRGKTQIKEFSSFPKLDELPMWGFDGSSTRQAEGHSSDCVLKPVALYPDAARLDGVLVMCEVLLPDMTPHPTNNRARAVEVAKKFASFEPKFGIEQEYTFFQNGRPYGWPEEGFPAPQGPY